MSTVKVRSRFSPRVRVGVACTEAERMTKSEFAPDCDINLIMARYKKTGKLPESAMAAQARFGDFSQVPTFQEMQDKVIAAHDMFAALPAHVRKEFDNDPASFISAADSPEGCQLLVKLGLGKQVPAVDSSVVSETLGDDSVSVPTKKVKKSDSGTIPSP